MEFDIHWMSADMRHNKIIFSKKNVENIFLDRKFFNGMYFAKYLYLNQELSTQKSSIFIN